jgi:hypothetical protein
MAPAMYALLEPNAFVAPVNLGPAPVSMPFATPAVIKMVDATFERDKNYFVSYKNINCACFRMLNELVPNQYKVSNTPSLIGWNATMSIQFILNQLEDTYGKPLAAVLFANDTLFKSAFSATKAPELLFYRIKQCQEIMTLGKLPYTPEQVIANALRLLMALQIFPTREFDMWENMAVKMYPALKTFIHEAYSHRLNSMELRNTTSTLGYAPPAQNMYHVLDIVTTTTMTSRWRPPSLQRPRVPPQLARWDRAQLQAVYTLGSWQPSTGASRQHSIRSSKSNRFCRARPG